MTTYEQIKNWLKEKENKDKLVLAACFILVFIVGFGTGRYEQSDRRDMYKPQTNYTTQQAKKPPAEAAQNQPQVLGQTNPGATQAAVGAADSNCVIKGNVSSSGRKIYHVLGGAFYKIVKPEQCFKTEGEALAAGFVKSGR